MYLYLWGQVSFRIGQQKHDGGAQGHRRNRVLEGGGGNETDREL